MNFWKETDLATHEQTVLAVDDDLLLLHSLKHQLTGFGYGYQSATNAETAMGMMQESPVDVLLCDVHLPQMSGLDLLQMVRNFHSSPDMLVIMMSCNADIPLAKTSLEMGANDFLIKPFASQAVPIAIEKTLLSRQIQKNRIIQQRNRVLMESIKALSAAMAAKEHLTAEHSGRIASIAILIANAMKLAETDKETLELAAYMHDIGKIGVPESILLKPESLSAEEWAEMRKHPATGCDILSHIEGLGDLARIIRHHHERIDGNGYPDGLSGRDIPMLSRILSVADAFDAMTSDRPYREQMSAAEAITRLREASGSQFDADVVEIFVYACNQQCLEAA